MAQERAPRCAACQTRACRNGTDCLGDADRHRELYSDPALARLHRAASAIEARHYCREPRIREVMLFARELNARTVGLAFCIGLAEEAKIIAKILEQELVVESACCKLCGIPKRDFELEQVDTSRDSEVMCNPAGQALILNEAGTELNILCGLCVGHDAIFSRASRAPVTTLAVKDRVLAHNPLGAVYSPYIRRSLFQVPQSPDNAVQTRDSDL